MQWYYLKIAYVKSAHNQRCGFSLSLHKEYLKTDNFKITAVFLMMSRTVWYTEHLPLSSHKGVTSTFKHGAVFWPTLSLTIHQNTGCYHVRFPAEWWTRNYQLTETDIQVAFRLQQCRKPPTTTLRHAVFYRGLTYRIEITAVLHYRTNFGTVPGGGLWVFIREISPREYLAAFRISIFKGNFRKATKDIGTRNVSTLFRAIIKNFTEPRTSNKYRC